MALAGANMTDSLLRAMDGKEGVIESTFVGSPLYKDREIDFFASRVQLGLDGVEKFLPIGNIDHNEQSRLQTALPDLKKNIERGLVFAESRG